jgi:formate C-acetyltransferase
MEIAIYQDELIVGNRSALPRMGVLSPEMAVNWIERELDQFSTRPQDRFWVSEDVKRELREEIFPYWKGRTLEDHILEHMPPKTMQAWQAGVFKVNQTDKGQGHILPDYHLVVTRGFKDIRDEIETRLSLARAGRGSEHNRKALLYEAMLVAVDAAMDLGLRYAVLARELAQDEEDCQRKEELLEIADICERVPAMPARTFREAVQSLWLAHVALQCESNASSVSLGRLDQWLYPYYVCDLESERLSRREAQEILDSLWIKCNEIVAVRSTESAKHFAGFPINPTITLAGQTGDGTDATNELSLLCLQAVANVRLPQPNTVVRLHSRTPQYLLAKTSEVIRLGTGLPHVFNDEVVIPSLLNQGVSLEDARDYAIVGCVEVSIPGKTYGLHDIALFNLPKALELAINNGTCLRSGRKLGLSTGSLETFESISDVEEAFQQQLAYFIEHMTIAANIVDTAHATVCPTPLLSSLVTGCIEKGIDVTSGGALYNFSGVQGIGVPNVADSLQALNQLVYLENATSPTILAEALKQDFEGMEELRQMLINRAHKYGNDIDEVDYFAAKWAGNYCDMVQRFRNARGGRFTPGFYAVSSHIPLGAEVGASPEGRLSGEPLADGGLSPMRGRDCHGPTAVLKSLSKIDLVRAANGSLLNQKFLPSVLAGSEGIEKLSAFLRAFVALKVMQIQFNVVSADMLKDAQIHPERYRSLVVRVAGYSAFFVDLNRVLQEDIIGRTEQRL